MPTASELPPLEYPVHLPLWTLMFDSKHSVTQDRPVSEVRGFRDGATGQLITYSELKDLSVAGCTALVREHGLESGQTVCLFGLNSIWYPVALFSVLRAGGIVCGASPAATVDEMTRSLKLANANIIFTSKEFLPTALAAAKAATVEQKNVILLDGIEAGFTSLQDLIQQGTTLQATSPMKPYAFPPGTDATNVCAFLSFSSGTTGLPKAVQLSHANMIAQCYQCKQVSRPDQFSNVSVAVLPFFFIAGLSQLMFLPFFLNQEMVILAKYEMKQMLEVVTKYKVNELWLVPPIVLQLAKDAIVAQYDFSTVNLIAYGAAPTSSEIITAIKQRFPHLILRSAWGMTEVCGMGTTLAPRDQGSGHLETAGKPVGGVSMKVINPTSGEELGPGESGEIMMKGPNVSMGYLNNDRATRETFEPDGWLHTGDLGIIDKEGFVTIQDRIKELIKVKGIQVAPAELEDLLFGSPLVDDVAVIGVKDVYAGELPKAFVVLKDKTHDHGEVRKTLLHFVKTKASRHKWLEGGIEFVDAIPKSVSGKILRRLLRDRHPTETKTGSKL